MNRRDQLETEIRQLAESILARQGLELVTLAIRGGGGKQMVRLDIDRAGAAGVTLDDCQHVSRELGDALDQADLMPSAYVLEVSSPGIDRPIRSQDDFRRNTGRRVVVTTAAQEGGRDTVRGTLLGCDDSALRIEDDAHREVRIPIEQVVGARQDIGF